MLEVLVVIAAVAVIASIVLAAGNGSHERARISRARAELAIIAKGLEDYRAAHGDYPQVLPGLSPESALWAALSGSATARSRVDRHLLSEAEVAGERLWIDPWGTPYVYRYRGPAAPEWVRQGYVLLSLGPSGLSAVQAGRVESPELPATGLFPANYRELGGAYDNILATH